MNEHYPYLESYQPAVLLASQEGTRSDYSDRVDMDNQRLQRLFATQPVVGIHDHGFLLPEDLSAETWGRWRAEHRVHFAYDGIAASGLSAGVFTSNSWHTAREIETMFVRFLADIDHHPGFHLVRTWADLKRSRSRPQDDNGSIGIILGLESMTEFAPNVESVELLYGLGVRVGGMIYSDGNILGGGLASTHDEGLTSQGREFVRSMNAIGMIVDMAHAGDRTTLEAIELSEKPILVSHAGVRSIWPTPRMKPNEVLRDLAAAGGLFGIEAAPNTTLVEGGGDHDIDQVMAHVEKAIEIVGISGVALGLDLTFGPHHQLHRIRAQGPLTTRNPVDGRRLSDKVEGMENPKESFWNAAWWLLERGYADDEVGAIMGGNAMRFFEEAMVA